jgi:hypothetical protein
VERILQVTETLRLLKTVSPAARRLLEDKVQDRVNYHTERCCDVNLSAEQSASNKEARALARSLSGFFDKEESRLTAELLTLKKGEK